MNAILQACVVKDFCSYLLSVFFRNFFYRKIPNGGSRAARVHGIPQRQIQELGDHTDQVTRVTKGNRQGLLVHS